MTSLSPPPPVQEQQPRICSKCVTETRDCTKCKAVLCLNHATNCAFCKRHFCQSGCFATCANHYCQVRRVCQECLKKCHDPELEGTSYTAGCGQLFCPACMGGCRGNRLNCADCQNF